MTDAKLCWLRGLVFVTLFAPLAGSATATIHGVSMDAAHGISRGPLDIVVVFLLFLIFSILLAGPLALAAGALGVGLAVRWARAGVPFRSVAHRLRLLGPTLGAACGLALGIFLPPAASGRMLPLGIAVGLAIAMLLPGVMGQPYRRLIGDASDPPPPTASSRRLGRSDLREP